MSFQSIQSDLLVELSIEQQELLAGGNVRRWDGSWPHRGGCGCPHRGGSGCPHRRGGGWPW
ncbi:hypothetical protein [Nostoc sp. FACHB-133]|uniref:hypothetical protein n=1 Tax=Nostoc sp. FACHB-133 TaxID=2692835 RepID=UPI001A7ED67A|nr:hypothetical protein [Nostoc sp. FACHB-133]